MNMKKQYENLVKEYGKQQALALVLGLVGLNVTILVIYIPYGLGTTTLSFAGLLMLAKRAA